MPIPPISPDTSGYASTNENKAQLTKDDFMKIFLKEMLSQDPLKPNDSSQMLQEMSQLTALSANEDLKKTIDSLNTNLGRNQVLSASQLIGKKVALSSGISPLIEGDGLMGSVIVTQPVSSITISIKDNSGNVVKTITKPASDTGVLDFSWDGKDDNGNQLSPDYYHISATGTMDGQEVAMQTAGIFKVNSVALDQSSNDVFINVDGLGGIDMKQIIKIL